MDQTQRHEMVLELNHASGMQGWYCPDCERRILLLVPPDHSMVIVEPGDPYVSHTGSLGSLRIGASYATAAEDYEISEERLRPWIKALEDMDLNW